jgi:hypothetical protein
MSSYRLCIVGLLLVATMTAAGCSNEEVAGPAGRDGIPDAFVVGYIMQTDVFLTSGTQATAAAPAELFQCTSRVTISNVLSLPGVSINGTELIPESMPRINSSAPSVIFDPAEIPLLAFGPMGGGLSYYGTIWIDEEENAHLVVEFGRPDGSTGTAEATVCVPDYFSILDVSNGGQITPVSDVTAEWSSSEGAEKYYIYGSYSCSYRNLSAEVVYTSFWSDTVVTDTTFVFQGDELFPSPPDLDYHISLDGYVYITAVCGPIETGDIGNVTGDGAGFFVGMSPSRSLHLQYMTRVGAVDVHATE